MSFFSNPFKTHSLKPGQISLLYSEADAWDKKAHEGGAKGSGGIAASSGLFVSSKNVNVSKPGGTGCRGQWKQHEKALALVIRSLEKHRDFYGDANVQLAVRALRNLKEGFLPAQLKDALRPVHFRQGSNRALAQKSLDTASTLVSSSQEDSSGKQVRFAAGKSRASWDHDFLASQKAAEDSYGRLSKALCQETNGRLSSQQKHATKQFNRWLNRDPATREMKSLSRHFFEHGPQQLADLRESLQKHLDQEPRTPELLQLIHDTSQELVDYIPYFGYQMAIVGDTLANRLPHVGRPKALNDALTEAGEGFLSMADQYLHPASSYMALLKCAREIRDETQQELRGGGVNRKSSGAATSERSDSRHRPGDAHESVADSDPSDRGSPDEEQRFYAGRHRGRPSAMGPDGQRASRELLPDEESLDGDGVHDQAQKPAAIPTAPAEAEPRPEKPLADEEMVAELDKLLADLSLPMVPMARARGQRGLGRPEDEMQMGAVVEEAPAMSSDDMIAALDEMLAEMPPPIAPQHQAAEGEGSTQDRAKGGRRVFVKEAAVAKGSDPSETPIHRAFARNPVPIPAELLQAPPLRIFEKAPVSAEPESMETSPRRVFAKEPASIEGMSGNGMAQAAPVVTEAESDGGMARISDEKQSHQPAAPKPLTDDDVNRAVPDALVGRSGDVGDSLRLNELLASMNASDLPLVPYGSVQAATQEKSQWATAEHAEERQLPIKPIRMTRTAFARAQRQGVASTGDPLGESVKVADGREVTMPVSPSGLRPVPEGRTIYSDGSFDLFTLEEDSEPLTLKDKIRRMRL